MPHDVIRNLPPIARNPVWEARVRKRCHTAMARRAASRARYLDLAAAAALCLYLAVVFQSALRLVGSH